MVMLCLGELAVHMPESGSFGAYAKRYIGPGTGYTITWLYWLTWSVTLGTEFTAAALLMQEWFQTALCGCGLNLWCFCILPEYDFNQMVC